MIDSGSPYGVITLGAQGDAAFGEADPEMALDQEHQGCPLVTAGPLRAFLTCGMNAPLYFDVLG